MAWNWRSSKVAPGSDIIKPHEEEVAEPLTASEALNLLASKNLKNRLKQSSEKKDNEAFGQPAVFESSSVYSHAVSKFLLYFLSKEVSPSSSLLPSSDVQCDTCAQGM